MSHLMLTIKNKMKQKYLCVLLLIIASSALCSCKKNNLYDHDIHELSSLYYYKNMDKYREDSRINEIKIYVSYPMKIGFDATEDPDLAHRVEERTVEVITDENEYKRSCDFSACLKDDIAYHILNLLIDAKEVDKEKIKTKNLNKEKWIMAVQGGMIIDVNYEDGLTESYIMNNDRKYLFYKKGEPEKFYKMPKEILDAYCSNLSFSKPRGTVFGNYILPEWICK